MLLLLWHDWGREEAEREVPGALFAKAHGRSLSVMVDKIEHEEHKWLNI